MTTAEPPAPSPVRAAWREQLDRVGFLRRALGARKWYGGTWWFVVIGASLLLAIITLAIVPQWFAPFDPKEEVGPRLLSPGETPDVEVIIGRAGEGIVDVRHFVGQGIKIAVVQGEPSSQVMRNRAEEVADQFREQGIDQVMRPKPQRFVTLKETLDAVMAGEVLAAVVSSRQWEAVKDQYPTLELGNSVRGEMPRSFLLGTNAIGQEVLSRVIWGTRIALIIGLSAALLAVSIGVPLGLFSGYLGGKIDRVLTVSMDSVYAFPGLVLAIAIAAVLGPSILNIVMVIGVVYVPLYFRIVRSQTLSIKEQLYVEAARSLGAPRRSILWRYVFPNVFPSVGIIFSVNVADAILVGAGLAFLGLGLPPETVDWGIDVARGQPFLQEAWWLITAPGVMIMLTTLAFTMMGESLAEMFNPRLAEQ